MTDNQDRIGTAPGKADSEFFTVGPPLHAVRAGYIRRSADDYLYDAIIAGHYAQVIAPEHTGKTSLIAATSARLQNNGYSIAILDLAQIGERDGGTDAGRWYYSIAYRLLRQLRIKIDLQTWWQDKSILSHRQRLTEFYIEVIVANTKNPVVIFIDELQCVEDLAFAEHLLASIRAAHNARVTEPEFSRLSFVICGECDPQTLIEHPSYSPFEVMRDVRLDDFTREEISLFGTELHLSAADADRALDRIFYWTSGQPYLTQKLARAIARERISGDIEGHVDRIATQQLGGRTAPNNEPHMGHIQRRILDDGKNFEALLNLYGRIRKGLVVAYDPESRHQRKLMAIGLLVVNREGDLGVRNRLYESVFTARWANENLPIRWRGPAIAAAVVLVLTAIPFWYTQILPRPYARILTSPTLGLETIADSYVNLRSFPGHATTADALFSSLIETRASQAADRDAIAAIGDFAAMIPGREGFAEALTARFWDRQVATALRSESRDAALLASLEALVQSTPERRRLAASLVGEDYPRLIATVAGGNAERRLFNPDNQLLSLATGGRLAQWNLVNQSVERRPPWMVSALEVTPLVRRVIVDRTGTVSRIGLLVNVGHARLDDIRMRLVAPSGRAVELQFTEPSSSANDEVRFASRDMADLIGESLEGTWTLSLRDESTGVAGHLIAWNLNLNSQVIVENFERGLDIPEPVERQSDNVWFSDDGRYAIARAQQSDSARLWDLAYAQAARTISVPASEQVLGVSANAAYLVTVAQGSVHLWRTASGRRAAELETGATSGIRLLGDGRHLLATRSKDGETAFDLWSLDSASRVAELVVAGTPALVTVDRGGNHLAVADYERAVRVWNFRTGDLLTQLDLHAQASRIELSPNGDVLGVVHGEQGVSLWRSGTTADPLLIDRQRDSWQIAFSPAGRLFLAGSGRQGFQVYNTSDGSSAGPPLGSGLSPGADKLLAFSSDERVVVTADATGLARFWNAPSVKVSTEAADVAATRPAHTLWRASGDSVAAISPGGERLALGDRDGHVHILGVAASEEELAEASDELSFLGHAGAVVKLAFSGDGLLVASAGYDGTIHIWDAGTGLPREYRASASASTIDDMQFSSSGRRLAVLTGQRAWIMNTETGAVLADVDLGELHASIAFADDDLLYVGSESGALRSLSVDRLGIWNLRTVWQGQSPLRQLRVSTSRRRLVLADADNVVQVFNINDGSIGPLRLELPDAISDMLFDRTETRVLVRTSRWIHRAEMSRGGLRWQSAIRAPQALPGSLMVFDRRPDAAQPDGAQPANPAGRAVDRVLLLTRDAGFAEVAELNFDHSSGPVLFGTREQLLEEWRKRIEGADAP